MKILAIRGENLASLKSFEVDLYGGVLGETGLFSITGPTGAGKSTLLDALCLALYGRIPRIAEERSAYELFIGEKDSLGVSDARHVMRRGATACFAEVDFEGPAGRWRARWSVNRARRKTDGKIQSATVELHNLDTGEPVGEHRPMETFRLIEERLGLTYDQFCRSVLLAQGDFASFLKAKSTDRAALLEKMTGTELYSRISVLAHERSKAESEKLRDLDRDAGGLRVLAPEERDALVAELTDQQAENLRLTDETRQAEAALRWHETAERLHLATTAADDERKAAHAASDAAEPERVRLRHIEKAEKVRSFLAGFDGANSRATDALRNVEELQKHLVEVETESRERAAAEQATREVFENAELERRSRQPEIDAAKTLDIRLTDAKGSVEAAERDLETAENERDRVKSRCHDGEREVAEVQKQRNEAGDWLTANAGLSSPAAQWERWKAEIERFGTAHAIREELQTRLDGLAESVARLERENQAAILQKETEVQRRTVENEKFDAASAALKSHQDEFPPDRLRADRDRLAKRQETLNEMQRLAEELAGRAADRASALANREREEKAVAACAARRDELAESKIQCEAALAARRGEFDLACAAEELAARRPDLLRPGQPCPLCGSTEHPDAGVVVHLSEAVEKLRLEVSAAEKGLADVQAGLAECERDRSVHQTKAEAANESVAKKNDEIAALTARWNDLPDTPSGPLTENVGEILDGLKASLRDELAAIARRETEAEELIHRRDAAREVLNEANEAVTGLTGRVFQTESALNDARRDREATERELQASISTCNDAIKSLTEAFFGFESDWRAELDADWRAFSQNVFQKVARWKETDAAKTAAETKLRDGAVQLELARAELARAAAAVKEKQRDLDAKREAQAAHAAERAKLLDGVSVEDAIELLDGAVNSAKEKFENARAAANRAEKERAAVESALRQAELAVETSAKETEAARAALDAGLREAEFSNLETARQLLDVSSAERNRLSETLDGAARRVAQAETVFQERSARLAAHMASDAPALDPALAQDRAATLRTAVEVVLRRIGEIEGKLKDDDEARDRLADRLADVARQRAVADRWTKLDDLIGSADGKKFRVFAQSLTLDILLGAANHYLEKLRPRYRLERVPNQDMELQIIDHDLGDEIRTCGSLSGGETFLVSLSLALGLSSLSSRTVAIESLFIDEGFGTLDKDSLESAVALLGQLAEGRKIGIISHIPDLAERIGFQIAVTPTGNGTSRVSVRR